MTSSQEPTEIIYKVSDSSLQRIFLYLGPYDLASVSQVSSLLSVKDVFFIWSTDYSDY